MNFLKVILGWITGGGLSAITSDLKDAYRIKLEAENTADRIEAEVRISQLQAQQAVLIAEQSNWLTRLIRPLIALPFIIFLWKVIVWDKVLKWGVTDALSVEMTALMGAVITAYFLVRPFEKGKR